MLGLYKQFHPQIDYIIQIILIVIFWHYCYKDNKSTYVDKLCKRLAQFATEVQKSTTKI